MSLELPVPGTFEQWLWLGIGLTFARSFGKRLDQDVQASDWFKNLGNWQAWIIKNLLDFLHHWWVGGLLMIYVTGVIPYWFGYGLLIDDLPDIPRRIKGFMTYLKP